MLQRPKNDKDFTVVVYLIVKSSGFVNHVEVVVPVTEACSSTRSYHQHGSVIFVLAF